jgi:threonine dehydrogenase-like Zn-dependent dehydrogenase
MAKATPVSTVETGVFCWLKMRSILLKDIGILELEDISEPTPVPGETLVRVTKCAICRTDAKMWAQGQRDLALPRVLGHEISGIREDTHERCVIWPGKTCGRCVHCLAGAENLCVNMEILGFNKDGGFAQKVCVPQCSLIRIPTTLGDDVACLAEPLACAINSLEQTATSDGDTVLIFGGGPVGLLLAMAAKWMGAAPSIIETSAEKLAKSQTFLRYLDIHTVPPGKTPRFDVAVNACPSLDTFSAGISRLRAGGRFCLFSGFTTNEVLPAKWLNEIHYRQLRIFGAYGCKRDQMTTSILILNEFQEVARFLIEEEIRLHEIPSRLKRVLDGQALKIVVNMEVE